LPFTGDSSPPIAAFRQTVPFGAVYVPSSFFFHLRDSFVLGDSSEDGFAGLKGDGMPEGVDAGAGDGAGLLASSG
jgi:hypothetical protein